MRNVVMSLITMVLLQMQLFAQDSIESFILVKAGSFLMGAPLDEPGSKQVNDIA